MRDNSGPTIQLQVVIDLGVEQFEIKRPHTC
jgi:hypothetical protein